MRGNNYKILNLWKKHFKNREDVLTPGIYPNLAKNSLLFIGLNPSFSKRGFSTILKDSKFNSIDPPEFYRWANYSEEVYKTAIELEELAILKYQYFKKMKNLAEGFNLAFAHIDLFNVRLTSQKEFKTKIYNGSEINDFGASQLSIAYEIIQDLSPIAIVVANALASNILKDVDVFKTESSDSLGCDHLEYSGRKVPVFFSSMLSGQRALDNFSFQRLQWHIRYVLTTS